MKYKLRLVRRLIICSFFLIPAGNFSGLEAVAAPKPIAIGVLHSEAFPWATMMKNSFEMALEVINKEGGIKGRPLKLIYVDDRGKREAGEDAVKKLAGKSEVVMLVGGYASSNTIYTAGLADKLDIPFLITTAADDRITQRKWRNVYRMNPPAQMYTKGVEDLLLKRIKPASMAIVYENSPFGTGSALRMLWFCRENDIELRKIIPYHKERASSEYFQKLLKPLEKNPPDLIYMVSYLKDAVHLVEKIKKSKINSLLIGGAGGFTHYKFIAMAGNYADRMLTATLWTHQLPYPGTKEYYDRYLEKHSTTPDYHGAEAYSALFVLADALKRAESLDPAGIRAALDKTDIMTAFGPVRFESNGKYERQNRLPTMVLQIINKNFEIVWPENVATTNLMKKK